MPHVVSDKILFLSEASKVLSSSLDYYVTLGTVAELIVTGVSDFCIIDIFDGRKMSRVAVRVADRKKQKLADKMYKFLPSPSNKEAIYDTAKNNKTVLIKKATPSWLKKVSKIKEERETIRKLGLNSHLFVPLKSRGQTIGVLTTASMDPNFSYSESDLPFIEELANRAATAVDKARLYLEAQKALRTRDEFLSVASHELKTPLTSILLNIQAVIKKIQKTEIESPEIREIVKMLELSSRQSHRMARLINDLLNVSVASTGRLQIEKEETELIGLVKEVILSFKARLKDSNIQVVVDMDEKIVGMWDKVRIEQVIANLLSNAIKYGKGKPILITVKKLGKNAHIRIKDNGIGIKKVDQEMIFEQFKRAVNSKEYSGLGVGLYICLQIVEAHKGKLSVESKAGDGASFIVDLPL
jgi:signal transduction histidine kinase